MAKCLNVDCIKEVFSQEGKRQKKTCSDSCRQKVWQKNKQNKQFIKIPYEEWERLTTIENNTLKKVIEKTVTPVKDNLATSFKKSLELANEIYNDSERFFTITDIPLKKEFRVIEKGESGLDYSIAKREFLNNQ